MGLMRTGVSALAMNKQKNLQNYVLAKQAAQARIREQLGI